MASPAAIMAEVGFTKRYGLWRVSPGLRSHKPGIDRGTGLVGEVGLAPRRAAISAPCSV